MKTDTIYIGTHDELLLHFSHLETPPAQPLEDQLKSIYEKHNRCGQIFSIKRYGEEEKTNKSFSIRSNFVKIRE